MAEHELFHQFDELPESFDGLTLKEVNKFKAQAAILLTSTLHHQATSDDIHDVLTLLEAREAELLHG